MYEPLVFDPNFTYEGPVKIIHIAATNPIDEKIENTYKVVDNSGRI